MADEIITGRKYRVCTSVEPLKYAVLSFFTKATDTFFNDNKTAEAKVGAINGISNSKTATDTNVAASVALTTQLNNDLGTCKLITEGSGANTKYYIQKGADTASKKPLGSGSDVLTVTHKSSTTSNASTPIPYATNTPIDGYVFVGMSVMGYVSNASGYYTSYVKADGSQFCVFANNEHSYLYATSYYLSNSAYASAVIDELTITTVNQLTIPIKSGYTCVGVVIAANMDINCPKNGYDAFWTKNDNKMHLGGMGGRVGMKFKAIYLPS